MIGSDMEPIIYSQNKREEFLAAARPMIKWINDNGHPHMKVIVDCTHAELVEGLMMHGTEEYVRD